MRFVQGITAAIFCALVMVGVNTAAQAERRVALVIGNDAYPNLPANAQLEKAVADSRAVRDALTTLHFEVLHAENVPLGRTKELLFKFSGKLKEGDIAFIFFAGHGVALGGTNYLLPTDIPAINAPETEAAIDAEEERLAEFAIAEDFVIRRIKATKARVGIVVLDACRDNPLRLAEASNPFRSTRPGDLTFGATRGLTLEAKERPEGIFSLYSANFGQRALDRLGPDDKNPNSPFTRVLLAKLAVSGLGLRDVMIETREEVVRLARAIGVEQRPALYDEVTGGDVYLNGGPGAKSPAPETSLSDPLASDYALAERVGTEAAWEAFLAKHAGQTGNFYVDLAKAAKEKRVAALQDQTRRLEDEVAKDLVGAECDRLASHPTDVGKPASVAGVVADDAIRPEAADACRAAVQAFPEEMRYAYQLGRALASREDHAEARRWCEIAASGGNFEGMNCLGWLLRSGSGGPQDEAAARRWWEKAALGGNSSAMNHLGRLHESGWGVTPDSAEAHRWYAKAAAAGHPSGMNNLGLDYHLGRGVERDSAEARRWLEKAIAAGEDMALLNLAILLDNGDGGPRDAARAAELVTEAIKRRHANTVKQFQTNPAGVSLTLRRAVQQFLIDGGYLTGRADGQFGPRSRTALDAWMASAT